MADLQPKKVDWLRIRPIYDKWREAELYVIEQKKKLWFLHTEIWRTVSINHTLEEALKKYEEIIASREYYNE